MPDLVALKAELDAGHPDTGAYSLTDSVAADEIMAVNRSAPAPLNSIREYFVLEKKANMHLYGRLQIIAEAADGTDPLGDAISVTAQMRAAAKAMLFVLNPGVDFELNTNDARFDSLLNQIAGGFSKVIEPADKTALRHCRTTCKAVRMN